MTSESHRGPSQRAKEVARDLFEAVEGRLAAQGRRPRNIRFHLDGSEVILDREHAEAWVFQSVDTGFPDIRFYVEQDSDDDAVINLAAFEDPDAQFSE